MALKLLPFLALVAQAADYNIVNLDNNTLKLLTGHSLPAFVRFDRDYPYGEKADAFKAVAQTAVGAQVLIGTVGISTYGEKMNQDLAERFGYKSPDKDLEYSDMDNIFPKYRFFPANGGADIEYTGPVTADSMTLFLKKEAKIYFGLKGTIREFDKCYLQIGDRPVVCWWKTSANISPYSSFSIGASWVLLCSTLSTRFLYSRQSRPPAPTKNLPSNKKSEILPCTLGKSKTCFLPWTPPAMDALTRKSSANL
ncbi:unnamed protein product [Durusdinium trenchii]|uniref:ERp29 N-terminal domain-containing protein n=1 Tax=Durusdinium trenchii TaxID=1381693 RepID=A0ABP0PAW6_9DINO